MKKGIFIKECRNRFLCIVNIDGKEEECYISNSSKLSNYISLKGKEVMLIENKGNNLRTKYTLQAAYINRRWVLLNLNIINELLFETFDSSIKNQICREYYIDDYKSDFYNNDAKEVIEVKGVLSNQETVLYPIVSGGRHLRQLNSLEKILQQGFKVRYLFVLMNPSIKEIKINTKNVEIAEKFKRCISLGMKIEIWTTWWYAGKCHLKLMPKKQVYIT